MMSTVTDAIRFVVFDYDDTLVGTHRPIWRLHKYIAKQYYGVDLSDADILAHWGRPIPELARHYYKTNNIDQAVELVVAETKGFPKERFGATTPTLRRLKARGKLVGVVSATNRLIFDDDCTKVGIPAAALDYIQTADDTSYHKPDKRVFRPLLSWAAERRIAPKEILYVGDGLQDMKAAENAGLNFLAVTTGLITAEDFAAHGAHSIASLRELL